METEYQLSVCEDDYVHYRNMTCELSTARECFETMVSVFRRMPGKVLCVELVDCETGEVVSFQDLREGER